MLHGSLPHTEVNRHLKGNEWVEQPEGNRTRGYVLTPFLRLAYKKVHTRILRILVKYYITHNHSQFILHSVLLGSKENSASCW